MILIDTHVHLYRHRDLNRLLNHAHKNFNDQATLIAQDRSVHDGVLCLTQTAQSPSFEWLRESTCHLTTMTAAKGLSEDWRVVATREENSLIMETTNEVTDQRRIFFISGQQIICRERLEVLSLANSSPVAGGLSLTETVAAVSAAEGVAIIPWGVGKWFGQRGQIVAKLMTGKQKWRFFLGDNSARPNCWPDGHVFKLARKKNIPILNGSDPLDFPSELIKPGGFGVAILNEQLDRQFPAAHIKALFLDRYQVKQNYGQPQTLKSLLSSQLKLNLRRIGKRGRSK